MAISVRKHSLHGCKFFAYHPPLRHYNDYDQMSETWMNHMLTLGQPNCSYGQQSGVLQRYWCGADRKRGLSISGCCCSGESIPEYAKWRRVKTGADLALRRRMGQRRQTESN